jgi:hypothetical protein
MFLIGAGFVILWLDIVCQDAPEGATTAVVAVDFFGMRCRERAAGEDLVGGDGGS